MPARADGVSMSKSARNGSGSATVQFVLTGYDRLRQATSTLRAVLPGRGERAGSERDSRAGPGREASSDATRDARASASTSEQSAGTVSASTPQRPASPDGGEDSLAADGVGEPVHRDVTPVSPRNRVIAALETDGDWTWQTRIVDDLDLSASTVSRHVSSLEDQGRVKRVSIGRQKVIGTPDADLDDIDPSERDGTD